MAQIARPGIVTKTCHITTVIKTKGYWAKTLEIFCRLWKKNCKFNIPQQLNFHSLSLILELFLQNVRRHTYTLICLLDKDSWRRKNEHTKRIIILPQHNLSTGVVGPRSRGSHCDRHAKVFCQLWYAILSRQNVYGGQSLTICEVD